MSTQEPTDVTAQSPISKERILAWHPGWLGVVLGLGGAAIASLSNPIENLPVDEWLGVLLTVVAVIVFPILAIPYLMRVRRHRHAVVADLLHPGFGAMFGTLPASMLIVAIALGQMGVMGLLPSGISAVVLALLVVGLVGVLLIGVEFFGQLIRFQQVPPNGITGAWFIPVVVLVLVPSVVVRLVTLQPTWAVPELLFGASAFWGAGMLLFVVLAPIVMWQLITGGSPLPAAAPSLWIWLAPMGAGGLGAIGLARLAAVTEPAMPAEVLLVLGLIIASALCGLGVWWSLLAAKVIRGISRDAGGLPFHVGSWVFAFPTAAMAALLIALGRAWESPFLAVVGAMGWVATILVVARLAWQTVAGVRSGSIFTR